MKLAAPGLLLLLAATQAASFSRTMFKAVPGTPAERRLAQPVAAKRTGGPRNAFQIAAVRMFSNRPQTKRLVSRRTQVTEVPAHTPTGPVSIQTQSTLDQVVESSIKNSADQKPKIIIINQPVPIGTEGNLRPLSTYNMDKGAYITGPYPPEGGRINGAITAYEIDGLMTMLSKISDLYGSFYDMLPQEEPSFNPGDPSLNVLEFYGKVRAFINGFAGIRVKLQNDINFAVSRLVGLRTGQDALLHFYGFYNGFLLLRKRTVVYEQRDPMFKTFAGMMGSAVEQYNQLVNSILSKTYVLQKLSRFLDNEVQELKRRDTTDNVLFVVDKFNDVLMFIVHILDIRGELMGNIGKLQKDLVAMKGLRRNFETLLTQIDQRVTADANLDRVSYATNKTQATFGAAAVVAAISAILVAALGV